MVTQKKPKPKPIKQPWSRKLENLKTMEQLEKWYVVVCGH